MQHLRNPLLKLSESIDLIFDPDMTSAKPYFIEALHHWISDNGLTPLIVVDVSYEGLRIPQGIDEEGRVTLNVSYDATEHLQMDTDLMTFNARFNGRSQALIVPMESISAIFARENGKGMVFEVNQQTQETGDAAKKKNKKPNNKRPNLTIVE